MNKGLIMRQDETASIEEYHARLNRIRNAEAEGVSAVGIFWVFPGMKMEYFSLPYTEGFVIGDYIIPISKIDEDVIKRLISKLEGSGIKGATVNRYLASIKTLLRHHRQSWEHIKLKKESKGRIRVISREEELIIVELLLGAEQSGKCSYYTEFADLIEVLVDTGCRLSEVLKKFTYKDCINYTANLMTVTETKNGKIRSLPMTKRVNRL